MSFMFSTRQTCIVLKSGSSSTARMPASSLVLLPCLSHHGQADGQLSPLYSPSPSFSTFGAAYVKLCYLPPSLVRNLRLYCLV